MRFEFLCKRCSAVTLFKEIKGLSTEEKACANCETPFSVQNDLIRFDRKDAEGPGVLISNTEEMDERLAKLNDKLLDLTDRFEHLEMLLLDNRENGDYVN